MIPSRPLAVVLWLLKSPTGKASLDAALKIIARRKQEAVPPGWPIKAGFIFAEIKSAMRGVTWRTFEKGAAWRLRVNHAEERSSLA